MATEERNNASKMSVNLAVPRDLKMFVERVMTSFSCGAHDMAHINRVCQTSQIIARKEGGSERIAFIGALCHDVLDSKLVLPAEAKSLEEELVRLLKGTDEEKFLTDNEVEKVLAIVKNVGFKNLLRTDFHPQELSLEYRCVQDADLLDAIGAIGVARCFAFGGKRARLLFELGGDDEENGDRITAERYSKSAGSGVEHFFEKLLIIKDMMTTETGRKMALKRQDHMVQYLKNLDEELSEDVEANSRSGDEEVKMESKLGKKLRLIE